MEILKIKNTVDAVQVVRYSGNKEKKLVKDATLLITDKLLAKNEELLMAINAGDVTVESPTGSWIINESITETVAVADDYTITIPAGEVWELASASLVTTAGTADLLLDGKVVISGADNDPVVTVNTTTFGQVFKVVNTIKVDQKTAPGDITLTLVGIKKRSLE
jgi:hypothetical protein